MRPLAGQAVSLLAGALVAPLTVLLAREALAGERHPPRVILWVPLLAGLLVALNGQLWQSSAVIMADTLGLAAATLGMVALLRYGRRGQARWLWLAAGALAFALLVRLAYALVALPAALFALRCLARQPRAQAVRHALGAGAIVLILLGPLLGSTMRDLLAPSRDFVSFAAAGEIYRWSPLTAFRREHQSADGLLSYTLPNGLYYAWIPFRSFFLSPLWALLIVPGGWAVWQRRRASLWLVVGWAASVYLFHAGTAWQNVRFTLAYLPPLALLAALGFASVAEALRARGVARGIVRAGLLLYLLLGVGWMSAGALDLTRGFIERMQGLVETVRWVEAQVPEGARLLTFSLTLTFEHESALETHELFFLSPDTLAPLLADERPTYLFLDVGSVESQWQGKAPALNYQWLRDNPGLRSLAERPPYTLFEVQGE